MQCTGKVALHALVPPGGSMAQVSFSLPRWNISCHHILIYPAIISCRDGIMMAHPGGFYFVSAMRLEAALYWHQPAPSYKCYSTKAAHGAHCTPGGAAQEERGERRREEERRREA